jgi:hypothetical protein
MGKLSRKQAVKMLNEGTITQESFDKMEDAGQIAKQRGNTERVIRSANNTWVTPMFYYKGLNGKQRSKKMLELRDKVNQLIADYTVSKSEVNQRSK